MEITNKTKKPLSIPLPAGGKLFLGPGKAGQITARAAASPQVLALVEAGEVALSEGGVQRQGNSGTSKKGVSSAPRRGGSGAMRQSGDK